MTMIVFLLVFDAFSSDGGDFGIVLPSILTS